MELQDILWPNGSNNDAGLARMHYYCALDDIDTFPAIAATPASATSAAELVTVADDFVFKSGKCFKEFYCTLEKGNMKSTLVGERDGKSAENTVTLFHPGNKDYLLGMIEYLKNTNLVVLVRELDGQIRIFGSEYLPANLDVAESDSGTKVADLKGITVTVKSIGRIAPIYTGAIPLTPAA
ncbi:hypothetical protein SAMN05421823_102532 [Catalinimonas alkaloidigena]|uniref:Uncharacterized protein n=1 Tax=Catalinimonas alkaloidigena TaxID=1075417 RepID=A0A1G9B8R6_9BACT|nr:hypothetical protein [Catalinimonas alkaloidigena]SDK35255.1 hypothetical protein SAMN05421823_102532 [Catalinimonas alkaloidigena]